MRGMPDVHDTFGRLAGTLAGEATSGAVRHQVPVRLPARSAARPGLPHRCDRGHHRLGHAGQRPGPGLHDASERRRGLHVRRAPALPDGESHRGARDRAVGVLERARRRVPGLRPRPGPWREHREPAAVLVQGGRHPGLRPARSHRSRAGERGHGYLQGRLRGSEPDPRRGQALRAGGAVDDGGRRAARPGRRALHPQSGRRRHGTRHVGDLGLRAAVHPGMEPGMP
jgi:hypothetical protein